MNKQIVTILLIGAVFWGWTERVVIKAQWQKYTQQQIPEATQTTVYTWKDSQGTVHYSTSPDHKNAKQTVIDTAKITRLEPLPEPKEDKKSQDKLLILEVREELERNRDIIQAEKERRIMQQ